MCQIVDKLLLLLLLLLSEYLTIGHNTRRAARPVCLLPPPASWIDADFAGDAEGSRFDAAADGSRCLHLSPGKQADGLLQ